MNYYATLKTRNRYKNNAERMGEKGVKERRIHLGRRQIQNSKNVIVYRIQVNNCHVNHLTGPVPVCPKFSRLQFFCKLRMQSDSRKRCLNKDGSGVKVGGHMALPKVNWKGSEFVSVTHSTMVEGWGVEN